MLDKLNQIYPVRYTAFIASVVLLVLSLLGAGVLGLSGWWPMVFLALCAVGIYDLQQSHHAILRNYPIIGHLRFMLETIRPEIRQYFLESETEAAPFSRAQRTLVYTRAKGQSDKRPFGTQLDTRAMGYEWINHSIAPTHLAGHDFRVKVGGKDCTQPYNISLFNVSAMSFGALSANAIQALNLGAKMGGFAHDTGEGSISRHHRAHGGDLIWEIGSGYFGCRDEQGHFCPDRFLENVRSPQVKMVEIKLSQGAKPGHGGVLPGPKVTEEIAEARGVMVGEDCVSPASHSSFSTPLELMAFIQQLRTLSEGKPVGFKLCIGHPWEWFAIVKAMLESGIQPDFIVVDGAEGGTGAAPLEFSDHMGMPLQEALRLVHNTLVGAGLRDSIRIGASGKIVSAFDMARALALGADWCNSARGFMFALGCIQAQTCHSGNCPTGVTTQDPTRQLALVVPSKAERVKNFHEHTLEALQELMEASGLKTPHDFTPRHIMRRVSETQTLHLSDMVDTIEAGALLKDDVSALPSVFNDWPLTNAKSFGIQAA
ncbi:MAG: FMN-binding glutamate synthase family protein [Burkholderiales bacterium 35-55-47]|jgi:glutamate synthase domain-containing protein 2|uniref:FMN-binding glutamate synthase family protein n=1 Tax=Limnohabitans sp. TaxID=1907725 RepID=UPI000BDD91E0|nr:FMN-binding glutamate synthase family protein [Limnohabitans sp.]OYY19094.1 MAG: FMN-binding glutamate synthase family protein [Burkholderiales bacterium 35-55-47]OYZ73103.1 MAG: FMN-binding glutamate synthase family protein [Burkholderiales bacterium 24-55-52]OZB00380.1 MAG: FMN-binding glutamate synthase family protein [Burkholderiales bacterium 39-55-53]HQR87398.1 FMN-binding glutamate synthase family protein [Limnohabitans sp.]HQS26810.1 FMN-binding glutamate synthase family protein [Li